jgi:hypothetical protein
MLRLGDEATSGGKLFQTVAPATGNARSLVVDSRQRGTSRWCDVDCRRTKGTTPRNGQWRRDVSEIRRRRTVQRLTHQHRHLEPNAFGYTYSHRRHISASLMCSVRRRLKKRRAAAF